MGIAEPLEVVTEFIKRINSGDVNLLSKLMTEDHIFQDGLGKRFLGRETAPRMYTQRVIHNLPPSKRLGRCQ